MGFGYLHLNEKEETAGVDAVPFWDSERHQETWLTFFVFPSASLQAGSEGPDKQVRAEDACRGL